MTIPGLPRNSRCSRSDLDNQFRQNRDCPLKNQPQLLYRLKFYALRIMPRKNEILNIGDSAPLFTLQSAQREAVGLESYRNKQHVILAFFRGTW